MAAGQDGLVTREQALAHGCSLSSMKRHVAAADLIPLLPGVYRMAGFSQTIRQQLRAACLWGGPGAGASHESAAALLRLKGFRLDQVHIVTIKQARNLPASLHVHRVPSHLPGMISTGGIPLTPPWITLVHLAGRIEDRRLARVLDDALHQGMVSLPQMRWAVDSFGGHGHTGSGVLRALLAQRGPAYQPAESELEEAFYSLVASSDLPPGTRQARVRGPSGALRLDYLWEEVSLIVEVDGWSTHGTREAFQADRSRDRAMLIEGRETMRFTWDDVIERPGRVLEEIRHVLQRKGWVLSAR